MYALIIKLMFDWFMTLLDTLARCQNVLPLEAKHLLMIIRRKKLWKEKGVIFIHIPKVAGVSINIALYGRLMGHFKASEVRKYAPQMFNSFPSFAVTRNPWERCLSAYRFVQAGEGKGQSVAGVYKAEQYQSRAFRSFESFVEEWLVNQDLNKIDYVFQPQLPFIADKKNNIIISEVFKLEDMNLVQDYLQQTLVRPVDISFQNRSGKPVEYQNWYTPKLVDTVAQIYAQDINAFDYSFE